MIPEKYVSGGEMFKQNSPLEAR